MRQLLTFMQFAGIALAFLVSLYLAFYAVVGLWAPSMEWLRLPFLIAPVAVAGWWALCSRIGRNGNLPIATVMALAPATVVITYCVAKLT